MVKEDPRRDALSGAEIEGDAKLTLPGGETISLPFLKVDSALKTPYNMANFFVTLGFIV